MDTSSAPTQRISYDPSAVQRCTLPNGLHVRIEPRPESELVTALLGPELIPGTMRQLGK